MTRFYIFCLLLFSFSLASFGQLTEIKLKITDNLPNHNGSKIFKKSATNPKTCGADTVEYPRRKATAFNSIAMRKNYSLGQIYGAPQDITIHGFTFYAWAVANPPTDKTVRLICNIYKAGSDSLPSGNPLQSDTVTVDSTFGGGVLTKLQKHAHFKTPVTVNYPYILTVESDSVSLSAGLVANSWTAKDGDRKNLLCGSVSGKWYRGLNLNIGGVTLDADMQFYPHVTYKFGTDFKMPDCFDFKDSARFKNDYLNNVSGSKFYSLYSFYDLDWYCHQWNYGEMPWNYYNEDGIYKYSGKGNFKVRLISYNYQWRGNTPCIDTVEKMLYFKPTNPTVKSNLNICRGDNAVVEVASDTGTTIKWYKYPSGSVVHTGETYNLGKIQNNDTFYIKAFNYHCESAYTMLIVRVNDYPKHPEIKEDSICLNAKANLEAVSNLGSTEWHIDSTFLPFFKGNVFQTGSLTKNASYFVRSNNNGCYSPFFKTVTAHVDNSFAPDEPFISNDTNVCLRPLGKAELKAFSKNNDSLRWYIVPSGGSSIASGKKFTYIPTATGVSTIYVEAQKSTCASSRLAIKITVSDYPSISQIFGDEKCKGDTTQVAIMLSTPGATVWYTSPTGGSPIGLGTVIQYYTLKSKNLYAEAQLNGCINPTRAMVPIKINAYDSITNIDAPYVCGNAKATLKVTAGTSLVKWYEDEPATKLLASTATYISPNLLTSTNYYFTVEKNGCKSPIYTVLAEVLPLPIPDFKDTLFKKLRKVRCTAYATTGVRYKWYMGDGNTYTSRIINHGYTTFGTFKIKLVVTSITSTCKDSLSKDYLFDFSGITPIVNPNISVIPNPASQNFKIKLNAELSKGKLSIISMDGKLVYHSILTGLPEIEISESFNPGTYLIKVESNDRVGITKLMIK
ncbi:MAG: T9SS type A sorting domain-containing protein [Bacteroidia bacterium]